MGILLVKLPRLDPKKVEGDYPYHRGLRPVDLNKDNCVNLGNTYSDLANSYYSDYYDCRDRFLHKLDLRK